MSPTFGTVLAALMAAHDFGDHIVQTDHQAADKAEDWRAMGGHVGGYTAAQVAALRVVGVRVFSWRTLAGVAFSAASHALIDRRWPVRWVLQRTGSPAFADLQSPISGPYLADQALHHACLFVSARIIAGRSV